MSDQGKPERPVRAAYREYLAAREDLRLSNQDDQRFPVKEFELRLVVAAEKALRAYSHPSNGQARGRLEEFPAEIAFYLAEHLSFLAAGRMPRAWEPLSRKEGKIHDYESLRVDAARYVRGYRRRVVKGRAAIKAAAQSFGVAETVIHGWARRIELPPLSDVDEDAEALTLLMEKAGEGYRLLHDRRDGPPEV